MLDVAVPADARDRRHVRACEDQAIAHHPPLLRLPKEAARVESTYAGMRKFETFHKVDSTDLAERWRPNLLRHAYLISQTQNCTQAVQYCTHAAGLIQTPTAYPVDWGSVVGLERCRLSWYRFTRRYRSLVYRVQN
jgi:hypothetical protein